MWRKVWEVQNDHQTGRWQWMLVHSNGTSELYPQWWMWGDAICPPPGVGQCKTSIVRRPKTPDWAKP